MRYLAVFFALALVLASSPLLAQAEYSKVTTTLQGTDKAKPIDDSVLAEHIIRQVFDRSYTPPYDLQHMTQLKPKWPEWEDVYFERDKFEDRMEKAVSQYWRLGHNPWQARVKVTTDEPIRRGGHINFVLEYPKMEFRKPWIISMTKADTTQMIRFNKFNSHQSNYFQVTFLMLLLLLISLLLLFLAGKFGYWLYGRLVDLVFTALDDGQGGVWGRRFAMCIVGMGFCIVFTILWIIL